MPPSVPWTACPCWPSGYVVPAGATPPSLLPGPPLKMGLDVHAYLASQRISALLIVHDGKCASSATAWVLTAPGRWTSFGRQVAHLHPGGAAIRDGHIKSMDDKVSDYIPTMKGSAYDEVSIRQLLTMTSGVRWNEDYADPNADVAVQQPQARARRGRPGELPAPPAARGAGRHALALQHRRDQPGRHPGQRGDEEAAGGVPVGKNLDAGRHGAAGHLDSQQAPGRKSAAAASRPPRATLPASACSS